MNEERIMDALLRMFKERATWHNTKAKEMADHTPSAQYVLAGEAAAYESAAAMLEYALAGDKCALYQFDYYGNK